MSESEASLSASSVATKTARGGIALTLRSGIVQVVQLGSTILVAHFIVPGAYGALTVALAAVGFARYAGDFGISSSFLPLAELTPEDFRTGALIAACLACAEAALLVLAAPLLAALLHGPSYTTELIRLLSICLVCETFRFGPLVRLNRELRFGRYGTLSLVETAILYLVQIVLLLAGAGVWALVAGQLARSVFGTIAYLYGAGGLVRPGYLARIRPLLTRALPYQGPAALAAASSLVFPLVLTVALSARGIGYWGWATVLATPITAIVAVVSAITLPSLARLRHAEPSAVEGAASIMIRASLIAPAVGAGMLLGFAHPIVDLVFGQRWRPAIPAVELNLVGIVPWTLSFFLAAVLESDQRARERFVAVVVSQVLGLMVAAPLALQYGVTGAAFVSAVVIPVVDVVILGTMARLDYRRVALKGLGALVVATVLASALARLATSVGALVACGFLAVLPGLAIVWFADREAVRAVLRYGVPLSPGIASKLGVSPRRPPPPDDPVE